MFSSALSLGTGYRCAAVRAGDPDLHFRPSHTSTEASDKLARKPPRHLSLRVDQRLRLDEFGRCHCLGPIINTVSRFWRSAEYMGPRQRFPMSWPTSQSMLFAKRSSSAVHMKSMGRGVVSRDVVHRASFKKGGPDLRRSDGDLCVDLCSSAPALNWRLPRRRPTGSHMRFYSFWEWPRASSPLSLSRGTRRGGWNISPVAVPPLPGGLLTWLKRRIVIRQFGLQNRRRCY